MATALRPASTRTLAGLVVTAIHRLERIVRNRPKVATLIAFCAMSFLLFSSTWVAPFTTLVGAPGGDQVGFLWALEWPLWALGHGHNPLFSAYLNAPHGFNVMWTYPPLPALVMAPVTLVAGPVFSYNLLVTLGLATSGWLATLATRRFVSDWGAAVAAGMLFGFGPYELGHALSHAALVAQFAAPLLLLLGHEAVVRQRWSAWRVGTAIGLVLAAQLLLFVESVAVLALVTVIALTGALIARDGDWRARLPRAAAAAGVAAAVFVVVCAYPLTFMLLGPEHLPNGMLRLPGTMVSNLANFVVPAPPQLLAPNHVLTVPPGLTVDGNPGEWNAYLGIPLLAVLAIVLARCWRADRRVRFLGFTLALVVVLSLGQRLWWSADVPAAVTLPAAAFDGVPLVENILWSRLAAIVDLLAAVLLAVYLSREHAGRPLLPRVPHRVLMVVLVASLLPLLPYPSIPAPVAPAFFTGDQVQRIPAGSTALVAPFTRDGDGVDPEYWQTAASFRFRMTGGYVFVPGPGGPSYVPRTPLTSAMDAILHGRRAGEASAADRAEMLTELTRDHIGTVIVGPMPHRDAMVQFVTSLLGRVPEEDQGVQVWWNVR